MDRSAAAKHTMNYPAQPHPPGHPPFSREPVAAGPAPHFVGGAMPPPNSYPSHPSHRGGRRGRDYVPAPASYGIMPYDIPANYSGENARNYTDSQLGVGGAPGGTGQAQPAAAQQASPLPAHQYRPPHPQPPPPAQQQYSTPRMPRHATVLKDRGSAENSVGSSPDSPPGGYGYGGGHHGRGHHGRGRHAKNSPPSMKGRGGSCGNNLNKADKHHASSSARTPQRKEMRSPSDGRRTPPRRDQNSMEVSAILCSSTR